MHKVRLRQQAHLQMATKSLPGQRHKLAWHPGSRGWCVRGQQIESRGNHSFALPQISREIGEKQKSVRVNSTNTYINKSIALSWYLQRLPLYIEVPGFRRQEGGKRNFCLGKSFSFQLILLRQLIMSSSVKILWFIHWGLDKHVLLILFYMSQAISHILKTC